MFDIGFFELLVIAVVALVVVGPERLPETVRNVSLWIGRLKRSLRETRSEIEKQIGADDIRRQLHNEDVMQSLEKTRRDIESAMQVSREAPTYTPHKELPDHAHQDETPAIATETTAVAASQESPDKT